jgi:hypothetical protein
VDAPGARAEPGDPPDTVIRRPKLLAIAPEDGAAVWLTGG